MHHCFFRSRYRWQDRNESWNLSNLCRRCHDRLHKTPALQEKYERLAFTRRPKGRPIHPAMLRYV
jgi:hypothetical protein